MVRIEQYTSEVEQKYWDSVSSVLDAMQNKYGFNQQNIIQSCQKFLPPKFFTANTDLKELVLAPFEKLKSAYDYIQRDNGLNMKQECLENITSERKPIYEMLYESYDTVRDSKLNNTKLNVFLVSQTGLTVCPYCNRDFINSRAENRAGAQLDHFYPRSQYPIFSLCLYNLVPVCGNCNRLKSKQEKEFASPFDDTVDWDKNVRFSYNFLDINKRKISIYVNDKRIQNNIAAMEIENAYQIHDIEIRELLDKKEAYCYTQIKEFQDMLGKVGLTEGKLKKMVFGEKITEERIKTKPLGRMMRDLERELHIYDE